MSDYLTDHEWSWICRRLNGFTITPSVRNQGCRPSCVFQAFSGSTDMETRRVEALRPVPASSNLSVDTISYVRDYEHLIKRPLGEGTKCDFGPGRLWSAAHLILHRGVAAGGPGEGDRKIWLDNVQAHGNLRFHEATKFIRKGKPVMGGFTCNRKLKKLPRGEIYSFRPSKWLPTIEHMVFFVGYGSRGGRPYLVFLNSDGEGFSQDGFGRIWFDEVRDFHTIQIRGQPFRLDPILTHGQEASYTSHQARHGLGSALFSPEEVDLRSAGDVFTASSSSRHSVDATPSDEGHFKFITAPSASRR